MRAAVGFEKGDVVPWHLNPGWIIFSYFISLAGASLTVELLHRRTALRGPSKWLDLFYCSVAMGLVGIWCMHFVGNQSIVMGNGEKKLQLVYSPGFTAISASIPVVALLVAFLIADRRYKGGAAWFLYLLMPGVLAGGAISGMHYVGNLGISNYHVAFHPEFVGGAVGIACFAGVLALATFFTLQDLWMSNFFTRTLCAGMLAVAVSAMHWVASKDTTYTLKEEPHSSNSRNVILIIGIVVGLIAIPCLIAISIWRLRHEKQLSDRAQQVVLSCAKFDPDGRLMVTQDGHLPCQKITVDQNQMAFEDEFDITHPVFQWLYRASHNWISIARFVPRMKRHLQAAKFLPAPLKRSESTVSDSPVEMTGRSTLEDYSVLFREAFCVAASDLASELQTETDDIGTLYEAVMMTGTMVEQMIRKRYSFLHRIGIKFPRLVPDLEADVGLEMFGKGQLLVLTSQCSKREASHYMAAGYRFETLSKITERLARNMQVPRKYLVYHLHKLREHSHGDQLPAPRGTLLGCFAIQAGINRRSWDVAVRKDCLNRLPYVQLSPKGLDTAALAVIQQLDGMTIGECCEILDEKPDPEDNIDTAFAVSLRHRIDQLSAIVAEPFFQHAIFSSKLVKVPTFDFATNTSASCQLLVFHIIPDVHSSSLKSSASLTYTPLSFFLTRQQCLRGAPHHASFDRKAHHEFAMMFSPNTAALPRPKLASRSSSSAGSLMPRPPSGWWMGLSPVVNPNGRGTWMSRKSESQDRGQELVDMSDSATKMPFGGIMVSQDVTVETALRCEREDSMSFISSGTRSYAGTADAEIPTYVDELFCIAVERWQRVERGTLGRKGLVES